MSDLTDRAKAALDRLQGAIARGATMFALEDIAPILNAYAAQPPGDLVRREECAQRLTLFAELFAADDEGLALAPDVWNRLRSDLALAVRLLRAATPQRGQGEPVAWMVRNKDGKWSHPFGGTEKPAISEWETAEPLFLGPPAPDGQGEPVATRISKERLQELIKARAWRGSLADEEVYNALRDLAEILAAPPAPAAAESGQGEPANLNIPAERFLDQQCKELGYERWWIHEPTLRLFVERPGDPGYTQIAVPTLTIAARRALGEEGQG